MSLACYKQYTVNVTVPITASAYWTLDEAAGSADRADSVGTADLLPLGITAPGAAGLISLGVPFTAVFGGKGYSATNAALGHVAGDSYSLWGWFKLDELGNGDGTGAPGVRIGHDFNRFIYIALGESIDPDPIKIETWNDTVYLPATLGAWTFFHLFYLVTLQQFGYSINAGFETVLPTAVVYGNYATGALTLEQRWTSFPNGSVTLDEIGFSKNHKLTSAEVNFLYNGGAGRTYPF